MAKNKKKLTTKQRAWVECYLTNGFNATQAAKEAGYKAKSDVGFRKLGYENRTKPYIKEKIEARLEEAGMGANEVIARLTSVAQGVDILDYIEQVETYAINKAGQEYFAGYDLNVDFKRLQADGHGHLIKKVRATAAGTAIEFHDSLQSLIQLAKVHGLLIDRVKGEVEVKGLTTQQKVAALLGAEKELEE